MSEKRANWFEMIGTFVQFYPKLSAVLAFSSMAALGGMMASNREAARIAAPKPKLVTSAIRITKRRSTAHKTSKCVRPAKRMNGRRKAA
jgi:hypothetical protein